MLKIDKINMLLFLMLFNFKVIYFLLRSYLFFLLFNKFIYFVIYSILFFYIYLYLMCNDLKINFIIKM